MLDRAILALKWFVVLSTYLCTSLKRSDSHVLSGAFTLPIPVGMVLPMDEEEGVEHVPKPGFSATTA